MRGARPLALLALATGLAAQEPALEHEWRTRALALDPDALSTGLENGGQDPAWVVRAASLEALRRALSTGVPPPEGAVPALARGLVDEHGDVQALALDCVRLAELGDLLEPGQVTVLAQSRRPGVRAALARVLGATGTGVPVATLDALVDDPDERVRAAARRALFHAEGRDPGWTARRLARVRAADGDAERLFELARLARDTDDPAFHVTLASGEPLRPEPLDGAFAALALARTGDGDARRLLSAGAAERSPELAELYLEASRCEDAELGALWLRLLGLRLERGDGLLSADELAQAAVATLGPRSALSEAPGDQAVLDVLIREVGRVTASWQGIDVERLAAAGSGTELVGALGSTLRRDRDATAGDSLARLATGEDEGLRRAAVRELAALDGGAIDEAWLAALHAGWRTLAAEDRERVLHELPRGRPLPAFEADLLALVAQGTDEERRVAVELCAGFAGNDAVFLRLRTLAEHDLERLRTSDDEARRGLELAVQGELRALAAVDAERAVPLLSEVLVRSLGTSSEVGKVAAAALGRTESGRARLAERLAADARAMERRTRIEVAIALARGSDRRATRWLLDDYREAAWDLRVRMLAALGNASGEPSLAFLAELARDERGDASERASAVEALAERGATELLSELALESRELELRRVAVRALGRLGAPSERRERALAILWPLFEGVRTAPEGEDPFDREERELLRADLLGTLGALSADQPRRMDLLAAELFRAPLEAASGDLRARFEDHEPAAPDFRWRGELALGVALARTGGLGAAFERTPDWPRADGEFLASLGAAVAALDAAAATRLLRAAVVALLGTHHDEGRASRSRAALFRSRLYLFTLARTAGRHDEALALGTGILAVRRAREFPAGVWGEVFGDPDFAAGRDPERGFEAALEQLRAARALGRGDVDAARAHAGRARARLGRSQRALEAQEFLDRRLEGSAGTAWSGAADARIVRPSTPERGGHP